MSVRNRRSLLGNLSILQTLQALGHSVQVVTRDDKPQGDPDPDVVLVYQDEQHAERPPPFLDMETGLLSGINADGERMSVQLMPQFGDISPKLYPALPGRRTLPSHATISVGVSRTNCVRCGCEIPPGKPGRECRNCRSNPVSKE